MTGLQTLVTALQRDPRRIAVEHRGVAVSAGEFLGRARGWAVHLRRSGLNEGDVLGVAVSGNLLAMELLLGAWMCGAGVLMIDFRSTRMTFEEWHGRVGLRLLACASGWPGGPEGVVLPRRVEPLETLPWNLPTNGDLIADHFVSSGTTGFPRAKAYVQKDLARIEFDERGTVLSVLSVAFSASRSTWYRKLASGKTIVSLDLIHTLRELDEAMARPDIEECSLPPVLIRRLAQLPPKGPGPRYPNLQRLNAVGGPAAPQDKLRALERLTPNFSMTYSTTDCGLVSRIVGTELLERPASCGRPAAGIRVEIRDGERLCAPGQVGMIRVHRPGQEAVEPGDLGWLDEAGFLYISGRSDAILCRHGLNVTTAGIERALMACDLVEDVVTWGAPDPDGGDRIHAAVQCAVDAETVIAAFIRCSLSDQERPDEVHFSRALPRGPAGKPDRLSLIASLGAKVGEGVWGA